MHEMQFEFTFGDSDITCTLDNPFVAQIPMGINGKEPLLVMLKQLLRFPDYFGCNWDALKDCLCDFSWIQGHDIVLKHQDIPNLNEKELLVYLGVLLESINSWRTGQEHLLIVTFPEKYRKEIETVLCKNSSGDRS